MIIDVCLVDYKIEKVDDDSFECIAYYKNDRVCRCKINTFRSTWSISAWYTEQKYQHNGVGILTMKTLMQFLHAKAGVPNRIEYIWDGTNSYVYEWLEENFDAICKCPIAVQKTAGDDDWDSHIYYLNVDKVLTYFKLK